MGTVFHLGEFLGLHGWRDMNQPDLTAQGMMQVRVTLIIFSSVFSINPIIN